MRADLLAEALDARIAVLGYLAAVVLLVWIVAVVVTARRSTS